MSVVDPKELAADIHLFLSAHARVSPDYDPSFDDPGDRFTGPDPSMLHAAAEVLERGELPADVWSSWESGCYAPLADKNGEAWHGRILLALRDLRIKAGPNRKP